jgi:bifunctional UDP-N-acetylglucosamine pyrophosphorylase / glucosamine-1-phosphate N-acetyltransferase
MRSLAAVILAAGKSTRMKSRHSKVLHLLAGRPVISYPIEAARAAGADPIVVVRGPDQDDLRAYLDGVGVAQALQRKALGTGHAVLAAERTLGAFAGDCLILCGDVPLVRAEALKAFVEAVRAKRAVLGILTMVPKDPEGYGRIIRDLQGEVVRIIEARDATAEERTVREVNSGIICADRAWLMAALKKVRNDNAKREYYLTDIVAIALREGATVVAHRCDPPEEFWGINTRLDLARVAELLRERINAEHLLAGVGILDPRETYIDVGIAIGRETTVMPQCCLQGATRVGSGCTIENGVILRDAIIGDRVHVKAYSIIEESRVEAGAVVGPFARLRPGSRVGREARVGNFVELKKCELRDGAKANHLTYLGDAIVGARANIGCGTITCNYDGEAKHVTRIGEGAFVGSDTQFVAPVRIGRGAVIGAGSTITEDVPADALALSRVEQRVVAGWARKRRKSWKVLRKK